MKKVFLLLALCSMAFAPLAFATSALVVDYDAIIDAVGDSATADGNSGVPCSQDGMLDSDMLALLSTILADTGSTFHDGAHAAWLANRAQITADWPVPALALEPSWGPVLAALMTVGDSCHILLAQGYAGTVGMVITPSNYDASQATVIAPGADPDGDTLTNMQEYTAIAGTGGPGSAKQAQYILDAQERLLRLLTPKIGPRFRLARLWRVSSDSASWPRRQRSLARAS